MEKTIAMRVLEGRKIAYEAVSYPETERDATVVAQHLGVPAGQVFKTLVVVRERGKPFLVLVPADHQLDLKAFAKAVGEKKVKMATHAEAEALTGLQVGGISPLALLNKGFTVLIDAAAREYEQIYVSAGRKGTNLRVPVAGLVQVTKARVVEL